MNDYRRVRPHDGYDIIARWGREKNAAPPRETDSERAAGNGEGAEGGNGETDEGDSSAAAREIRGYTRVLERSGRDDDSDGSCGDDGDCFQRKEDGEEEPYYVSPTERAGAFFLFTSNVDAHSFDVFESHEIRECHGNVEMWQCHDFACGTNDTFVNGGSLDSEDEANGGSGQDDGEQKWTSGRRLWRLPPEFSFRVDTNTMCAPYTKAPMATQTTDSAPSLESTKGSSGSPPALKRMKSCTQDSQNDESAASSVSDQGKEGCRNDANSDSNAAIRGDETAAALGGIMEDALRNHLAKEPGKIKVGESGGNNGDEPAHVGDVHGKPRLHPLRHMYPPATNDDTAGNDEKADYYLPIAMNENWPRCPHCREAARPAVLMFGDLDWVYNRAQERRWQRWCTSLLRLCKLRGRGADAGPEMMDCEGASAASDNGGEGGRKDVGPSPPAGPKEEVAPSSLMGHNIDATAETSGVSTASSPPAGSERPKDEAATSQSSPTLSSTGSTPLKVTILEIGCGYNVPTCRVIAERLVGELVKRGGDATLVRNSLRFPDSETLID